jgi:hypothetical protein
MEHFMTLDQFDDFKDKYKEMAKPSLDDLMKESHALSLKQEKPAPIKEIVKPAAVKSAVVKTEAIIPVVPAVSTENPYKRAHQQVLDKWLKNPNTRWKARTIEAMERGEYPKDHQYDAFVTEVRILGDSL